MAYWHGGLHKRKDTGGKRHPLRKRRKDERGGFPTETRLGEVKAVEVRTLGGNVKRRLLRCKYANVSDTETRKTQRLEVLRVVKNPANVDLDRRGVITKGAIIETALGQARVTSKPGKNGVVNAVLLKT